MLLLLGINNNFSRIGHQYFFFSSSFLFFSLFQTSRSVRSFFHFSEEDIPISAMAAHSTTVPDPGHEIAVIKVRVRKTLLELQPEFVPKEDKQCVRKSLSKLR